MRLVRRSNQRVARIVAAWLAIRSRSKRERPEHRLVLIEATAELQVDAPNLVGFEVRREQVAVPAVSMRDLLRGCDAETGPAR